jgi:tRNA threonylcarbamoyl adenosine modification protein YeaZ/ribosomal-protein-alanine acetyltransferase
MKILALDSSGLVASVAIVEDSVTVAEYTINHKKTHSQTLLPMLNEVKEMTQLDLGTIDAIAVAAGPGSFTGLRIGSATAKGLGLALNIPIIPVPTVDALAYNLYRCADIICPIMDARRNQVYTGLYKFENGELEVIEKQCAVDISEIVDKINDVCTKENKNVIFLGDGVSVYRDKISQIIKAGYSFAPNCCNRQRAACVAALAERLYEKGIYETAADHAPDYLRLSQAEREKKEKEALDYIIRPIEEKDLEQVTALEASCFSQPWKYNDFKDVLTNPDRFYLVAVSSGENGKILGGIMLTNISGEGDISNVAVLEQYRGKKIATALLSEMIDFGKSSLNIKKFILEVRSKNTAAVKLYENKGFVSAGIRPNFYDFPKDDAIMYFLERS